LGGAHGAALGGVIEATIAGEGSSYVVGRAISSNRVYHY